MAIRTVTGGTGGSFDYSAGWKELTISNAKYGNHSGTKFIDIWFQDYPENLNVRAYAVVNKKTKEEFRIANWFKFSNSGIQEVIDNGSGKPVITYDDDPENLVGSKVNVFFYKVQKEIDGELREFARMWREPAPVEMDTDNMNFNEKDVTYWKGRAEKSYDTFKELKNGYGSSESPNNSSDKVPF